MGPPPGAAIRIAAAADDAELRQVFAFRYRIYVEEMNRVQHYADHARRQIVDPLDGAAHNLVAWNGAEVVGVVRVNFAREGGLGLYEALYGMADVGADHPARTAITTRLMTAPEYRGSPLAVRLSMAAYGLGLAAGIRWNFMDCNDHLVPFFTALGYVRHRGIVDHPEYGAVHCMVFDLEDRAGLAALRSPLLRVYRDHADARAGARAVADQATG